MSVKRIIFHNKKDIITFLYYKFYFMHNSVNPLLRAVNF